IGVEPSRFQPPYQARIEHLLFERHVALVIDGLPAGIDQFSITQIRRAHERCDRNDGGSPLLVAQGFEDRASIRVVER
ncbi:MAG: hypothetical protein ACPHUF_04580, partial [Gammaproteobacteria bacterium]